MKKILFFVTTLIFITIFIAGCRPSYVVRDRPYAPRYSQPLAPGPGYIWVSGEWVPRHGTYQYRRGYWAPARRGHMNYVEGHWQSRRGGWVWMPGHWR